MGRPIEYDAEKHALGVAAYVQLCKEKYWLPTIEGLAVELSVARATLYDWAQKYPDFSDIFEQLKALQASMLIQNGLKSEYNPTIAKLILTKHGYTDKQETDITTKGEKISSLRDLPEDELRTLAQPGETGTS